MPELPEVEGLVRFLADRTTGLAVRTVQVGSVAALKTVSPPIETLVGATVSGWVRRGKWLVAEFAQGDATLFLAAHLARGGWLRWYDRLPSTAIRPRLGSKGSAIALRVGFAPECGFDLTEAGTQKRLAIHVVSDPTQVPAIASLGIDPLSDQFTPSILAALLAEKNQQLKGLLRDQAALAGIGNAYSDEILHVARLSPYRLTRSLPPEVVEQLHRAIIETLTAAVRGSSGRPAKDLKDAKRAGMRVHGRTGLPCPTCGNPVQEVCFADRALQYCPTCQTGGKLLADRRLSRLLK